MPEARDLIDHIDYASDAAFAVDGDARIVAWNRAAQRLLGYPCHEVLGRSCYDVLQAVLPGGEPLCGPECPARLCFGRCQPFSVGGCRVRHRDGWPLSASIGTVVLPPTRDAARVAAVVLLRPAPPVETPSPLPPGLRIFTLGHFGIAVGERGLAMGRWERKQAVTLLKYLAAHVGRDVHRERLIELLWPEAELSQGLQRLKVTVYFLRRQLRSAGVREDAVANAGRAYVLRREAVWVDAEAFERFVAEGAACERRQERAAALRCYEAAQRLYRGDYLEEDLYADWCAEERERLHELYLEMLARMARCYAREGRHAEAAHACRTALVRDPCRESFHRALIEHLIALGRPDRAIAQFHRCQQVLARELGLAPAPETRQLYARLVKGRAAEADPNARRRAR